MATTDSTGYCNDLWKGAIPPEEFPIPLSTKVPPKSRKALHEKLKATADRSFPSGKCSFVFDDAGNCVAETIEPPAGIVGT